jgi:pyruvate dehydrogenase E2 component (dihydrolipoamide acetyltransferase)
MRRLASNLGVSLDHLSGTGPSGRLLADDVHRAATTVDSPEAAAPLTTVVEADVTSLVELLGDRAGAPVTLTALIARAAVEVLRSLPLLNSGDEPHLGIAVDTESGVVVPVVRDAGDLNVLALTRIIDELATRARDDTVTSAELSGGTFTLHDAGSRGVLFETPTLVTGQVASLGTGSVTERPVVMTAADGQRAIAIRSIVWLALTYDSRVVGRADAARFLHLLTDRLNARSLERHVSR